MAQAPIIARRNSGRAIRSLQILIVITVISLGVLSAMVTAPPSPLVGIGFAASALIFTASLTLASRITIALERARRATKPSMMAADDSFPVLSRIFRRPARRIEGQLDDQPR